MMPVAEEDPVNPGVTKRVFKWVDGKITATVMQAASTNSDVILLLDEFNLAPQAVLDACAPLLSPTAGRFTVPNNRSIQLKMERVRVVAAINPVSVGGNRNRLPRGIINQFVRVPLSPYSQQELRMIALDQLKGKDGLLNEETRHRAVDAMFHISNELQAGTHESRGSSGTFNLRDIFRFKALVEKNAIAMQDELDYMQHVQPMAADGTCADLEALQASTDSTVRGISSVDGRSIVVMKLLSLVFSGRLLS